MKGNRFRCRLRYHNWTVWGALETIKYAEEITFQYSKMGTGEYKTATYDRQRRQCQDCGVVQQRCHRVSDSPAKAVTA